MEKEVATEKYTYCNVKELIDLNIQYQDLLAELKESKKKRLEKYTSLLRQGNFRKIFDEMKYRNYARKHFSLQGNKSETITYNSKKEIEKRKIAVYSCITGEYDKIIEPLTKEKSVDYFMFTDQDIPKTSIWKKIDITNFSEYKTLTAKEQNRRIKMIPYDYLFEYDYSVYVDGNIQIIYGINDIIDGLGSAALAIHYHPTRDCIYDEGVAVIHHKKANPIQVKIQLNQYQKEGFPKHYGMTENSIIVRKHNNQATETLMRLWWEEYKKYPTRDQFTLPYLMWKTKYPTTNFISLGDNLEKNPYFNRIQNHLLQV